MNSSKNLNKMIKISLLAAIAVVLMYFDFPIIPAFPWLKIDLSEVPALMGGFAYGPVAGGIIVILKVFLRFLIKGTETGFVGALVMQVLGIISNVYFLLPAYGMHLEGSALINYIFLGLVPFNGVKALIVCIATYLLYKRVSRAIFNVDSKFEVRKKEVA